jgi:hypothetical protein
MRKKEGVRVMVFNATFNNIIFSYIVAVGKNEAILIYKIKARIKNTLRK